MLQRHPSGSPGFLSATILLVVPLGIIAVTAPFFARAPEALHASGMLMDGDRDNDGLRDAQEAVLGTSPSLADTDGDGFTDLEEFARHSDPLVAFSVPAIYPVSVALSARGEGNFNYVVSAVYSASGTFSDKALALGVATGGRLIAFTTLSISNHSTTAYIDAPNGGRIWVVDRQVHPSRIQQLGYLSYFGAIGERGRTHRFQSAAIADLRTIDGLTVLVRQDHAYADWFSGQGSLAPAQSAGGAHTPIPASGQPDAEWTAGSACIQQTSTVGSSGALLTQEVTDAACEDGWDSFCSGGCAATTGSTFDTVDPVALVGG